MKTLRPLRLSLVTGLTALVGVGVVGQAQAQSVATVPVGAVTKNIPVGLTAVGLSLLESPIFSGSCSSNTPTVIELNGSAVIGGLITAGESYYVEVVAGALEGDRFDVNTSATITAANNTIVLNSGSVNNTHVLTPGALSDHSIVLRRHHSLERIAALFDPPLIGNNVSSSADQIWLYDSANDVYNAYYLRADNSTWRLAGTTASVGKTVIVAPGVGCMVLRRSAPTKLVHVGNVRGNDFVMPLPLGLSFRAAGYPIPTKPATVGGSAENGWTGSNASSSADQIQVYDPTNDVFVAYYLRADGLNWRQAGTTTVVTNNQLADADEAFMILRKAADTDYILTIPYSLN